jgi:hypothetical protein
LANVSKFQIQFNNGELVLIDAAEERITAGVEHKPKEDFIVDDKNK